MAFILTRNFQFRLRWDRDEIMPSYYVKILGLIYCIILDHV